MSGGRRSVAAVYFVLALVGAVLSLGAFVPWAAVHGPDAQAFVGDLFANGIAGFFGLDVIVSAAVLTIFVVIEGARAGVAGRWWAVVATFLIGVSCGLPLFLALRERALMGNGRRRS